MTFQQPLSIRQAVGMVHDRFEEGDRVVSPLLTSPDSDYIPDFDQILVEREGAI